MFKKIVIKTDNNNDNIELVDIETKLFEKLHNNNNQQDNQKIMFVFHNINNTETDFLSKILFIFNKKFYISSNYVLIGLILIK